MPQPSNFNQLWAQLIYIVYASTLKLQANFDQHVM